MTRNVSKASANRFCLGEVRLQWWKTDEGDQKEVKESRLPRWEASSIWQGSRQERSPPGRGPGDLLLAWIGPSEPSAPWHWGNMILCFFLPKYAEGVFFSYWVHVLPMFIMKSAASATIKPIPAKHNFESVSYIWKWVYQEYLVSFCW